MKFPKIDVAKKGDRADALAICWFQNAKKSKGPVAPTFAGKSNAKIKQLEEHLSSNPHFLGKRAEADLVRFFAIDGHPNTILVGLGPEAKFDTEALRRIGASVFFTQKRNFLKKVAVDAKSLLSKLGKKEAAYGIQAFCEGYWLAGYRFDDFKKKGPTVPEPAGVSFTGIDSSTEITKAIQKANGLAQAIYFTRSLGDHPSNLMAPPKLAATVEKMAKANKLKCTVWNKARIQKEKMGLLMGVGQGSVEEPRFIILEHKGGKRGEKPIALIGKGITFDTGGISIKPSARMEEMKYDMMGSATVAGTLMAAALLKLPVNVVGYIAAAENMPGGRAQKPGDVAFSRQGRSVEITNTDAEGRLVMADALEYAQEQNPQAMFDFATLTGAVILALGSQATGIMGNNQQLLDKLKKASEHTKERVWELPLFDEYKEAMASSVADINNSSNNREAGSSKGGIFLKHFVDDKMPWVHCDIAGSGMQRRDLNYAPRKYASGAMVRTMAHLLETWN